MYLTIKEVQEEYKISRSTVYRLIEKGLPVLKVGKSVRIKKEDLENFLKENQG